MLALREWKSDTLMGTALHCGASLRVPDRGGLLAEASIAGNGDLGGSAINPPEHAKAAVPAAARAKLEALLSDPAVAEARRSRRAPRSALTAAAALC